MKTMKNACEPTVPRKRSSDDSVDRDLEKLRKQKPMVQAACDLPSGCGIKEADRKPLKLLRNAHSNLDNVDTKIGTTNSRVLQHDKLRSNKPSYGSKPAGKVKFWDPTKEGHDQQPKVTTTIVVSRKNPLKNSNNVDSKLTSYVEDKRFQPKSFVGTTTGSRKEHAKREKIKEVMRVSDKVYTQLLQAYSLKSNGVKICHWRVSVEAAKIAQRVLKWMEPEKSLGPISGVQIGDKFKHRSQLKMIGLHCQLQSGIDYTNVNGQNLTISIVDSRRYSNERASSDRLIYCGQGGQYGLGFLGGKSPPDDQRLERGNLALKNSMDERSPVRVIRKVEGVQKNELFVYDGLYVVVHCTQKRNEAGNMVFKFQLNRVPGQPPLHLMLNANCTFC